VIVSGSGSLPGSVGPRVVQRRRSTVPSATAYKTGGPVVPDVASRFLFWFGLRVEVWSLGPLVCASIDRERWLLLIFMLPA